MKQFKGTTALEGAAVSLDKVIDPISKITVYISSGLSLLMAVIIMIDIFLRVAFNSPLAGSIEITTFLLAVVCFLSLSYTMEKDGHVSVDFFIDSFSERVRGNVKNLFYFLGSLFFAVLFWQYIVKLLEAVSSGETSSVIQFPMWPMFLVTAIGCGMIGLVLISKLIANQVTLLRSTGKAWVWTTITVLLGIVICGLPWILKILPFELGPSKTGVLLLLFMVVIMFMGFPVAFSMGLVGILGTVYLVGFDTGMNIIRMSVYDSVANYFFSVVPFFVLMGFFCLRAGVSVKLYETGHKWFGHMPGGLSIATVFGCGGFAAICGDSMATAATMGSVSLPEMKRYKYDDALATGAVAAGGTLGILIPPSLGFIVYAIVTGESVGKLFMAGIIPGLILTVAFAVTLYVRCKLNPSLGPQAEQTTWTEKIISLKDIWSVTLLFIVVIGGIYGGFVTPTEAGAVGVIGALLIAVSSKDFGWAQFVDALIASTQITAMVAGILIGVSLMGYFITLTEIPMKLADIISSLQVSRYVLFVMILGLYLILGMVMNIIPMIMLTLPIIFPTIMALGFNPIWFGVIMVIMMEMGQISPPVGINVFVIHGISKGIPMSKIYRGVLPFVLVEVVVIIVLTVFPEIVMFLPDAMDVLPSISD